MILLWVVQSFGFVDVVDGHVVGLGFGLIQTNDCQVVDANHWIIVACMVCSGQTGTLR